MRRRHGRGSSAEARAGAEAEFRARLFFPQGQPTPTDGAKKELEARMEKVLPKAGLAMLLSMSADALAAELK